MLLKVSKRPQTRSVTIYGNITPVRSLGSQPSVQASLDSITLGRDRILCIQQQDSRLSEFKSLEAQGLWVSTGKLVWFRNRDLLSENKPVDGYPLYWADNQNGLMTQHPIECDREQPTATSYFRLATIVLSIVSQPKSSFIVFTLHTSAAT